MDGSLFMSLIRNLLHAKITAISEDASAVKAFEDTYCYHPSLQPFFTAERLKTFIAEAEDKTVYEVQDCLGICVIFFRLAGQFYLIGPFVRREYDQMRVQNTLIENRIPASFASSIKVYFSAFPLLSFTRARETVAACIRALTGTSDDYAICRMDETTDPVKLSKPDYSEEIDYSTLYRRYELENRFLYAIRIGDTENILTHYLKMTLDGMGNNRYINAVYQEPIIGLSMVRALARKAAEDGGAPIVEINEITQRAVQKTVSSSGAEALAEITRGMLVELTEAVRRSKLRLGKYTEPIRKTVEYLGFNMSQNISLSQLSRHASLSESYLSRQFKNEVGMTISQYIAHLRCSKAAEIIKGSNVPIQEIASYVGYEDNNYFVKVFKKQYGVTPTEFRSGKNSEIAPKGK